MRTLEFGHVSVTPILDSSIRVPGDLLYRLGAEHYPPLPGSRGLTPEDWAEYPKHVDHEGLLHMHFGGHLVRGIEDRVILVDLGTGPAAWSPPGVPQPYPGVLIDSLREQGVDPGDVTDVVFTHLHPDHIGWASIDGTPVFESATYRCAEQDWAFFMGEPNPFTSAKLEPIRERVEVWSADQTLFPGLDLRLMPGHTPGSTAIVASSGDARAFLIGDLAHCPHELMCTTWAGMGDADPAMAAQTRLDLAAELEASGAWAGSSHFAGLGLGRLTRHGSDCDFEYDVQHLDDPERATR